MQHRYGDSLWQRFLRWLMPANGGHAKAEETGELPVYEEDGTGRYDVPIVKTPHRLRETRYDLPLVRPYVKDRAA